MKLIKSRALLAPLAGMTDRAFRTLCKEHGAHMCYCEMVSAKGMSMGSSKTFELIDIEKEGATGVQLFGREPHTMAHMAQRIEEIFGEDVACIDVNMGCPVPKVAGKGEGSALMNEPELAADIIKAIKSAVKLPVTAKIRKGWKEDTAVEFAKTLEGSGVDLITVHGRTREQMYHGKADYGTVERVKRAVSVPVVGNGDIYTPEDAERMLQTGCDAVMVARGAFGNPFIFRQISDFLEKGSYDKIEDRERLALCITHAKLACEYKDEYIAIRQMRTHGSHYIKGMHGAAALRNALVKANTLEDFVHIISEAIQRCE